jgi:Zn-dependent M16 (insulinase) family peptidase
LFHQALIHHQSNFILFNKRDPNFTIGVQGVNKSNIEKIESVILQTLEKSAVEGFSKSLIDSVLHNIEISIKKVIFEIK